METKNNFDYWNSLTIKQKEKHLRQKEKELGLKEGCIGLALPFFERLSDEELKGLEEIDKHPYSIFPKCSKSAYVLSEEIYKHDPEWIMSTEWARQFDQAQLLKISLKLLEKSKFKVEIFPNTETGYKRWAIVTEADPVFWIDSFRTKKEAVVLCRKMGWEVMIC